MPVHRQAARKKGRFNCCSEQQPCGVQVVERVGLVASSFQFFTRLAAVFAEEVGSFDSRKSDMPVTHFAGTGPGIPSLSMTGVCFREIASWVRSPSS